MCHVLPGTLFVHPLIQGANTKEIATQEKGMGKRPLISLAASQSKRLSETSLLWVSPRPWWNGSLAGRGSPKNWSHDLAEVSQATEEKTEGVCSVLCDLAGRVRELFWGSISEIGLELSDLKWG